MIIRSALNKDAEPLGRARCVSKEEARLLAGFLFGRREQLLRNGELLLFKVADVIVATIGTWART